MNSSEDSSVFLLLTNLIEHNLNQCIQPLRRKEHYDIIKKKLRIKSFEILLKSHSKKEDANLGPLTNMVAHYFQLTNHSRTKDKALQLNNCLITLINSGYYQNPIIFTVLEMLVQLIQPENDVSIKSCFNFKYYENPHNFEKVIPYKIFTNQDFELPPWMLVKNSYNLLNNNVFLQEPGTGLKLLTLFSNYSSKFREQMNNYNLCTQDIIFNIPEMDNPRELNIPYQTSPQVDEGYDSPCMDLIASNFKNDFHDESVDSETTEDGQILNYWETILSIELPKLKTWETLGNLKTEEDKSFLCNSGLDIVHKLWRLNNNNFKVIFERNISLHTDQTKILQVISLEKFLSDLKNLLIGIQSTSFTKECNTFILSPNICLNGLSPEIISSYSEDFIICGTFYHRLKLLCEPKELAGINKYEGNIFKALCESIKRFLLFYRVAALSIFKNKNLLKIKNQLAQLKNMIVSVARLARLDISQTNSLPEGVNLLAYLYEEIAKVTDRSVSYVLFSALQSCCQVYYRFIQQWIFEGVCEDPYEEFFIHYSEHYTLNRNRKFWNKSFKMINSAVPGFLNGIQNQIFQCGKAVHLLKLCKPEEKLFVIRQNILPEIKCCFTKEDQYTLQNSCDRYYKEVLREYGPFLSISTLLNEENEKRKNLERLALEEFNKKMKAFESEQKSRAKEIAKEKEKQLSIIMEQISQVNKFKKEEKHEQLQNDKEIEDESKKINELINTEKDNLIKYYETLSLKSEDKRIKTETYIKELENKLVENPKCSNINENTKTNPKEQKNQDLNSNIKSSGEFDFNSNFEDENLDVKNHNFKQNIKNDNNEICNEIKTIQSDRSELTKNRWRNLHGDYNIITGEFRSRSCERFSYKNSNDNLKEKNLKRLSSEESLSNSSYKTAPDSESKIEISFFKYKNPNCKNKSDKNKDLNSNVNVEEIISSQIEPILPEVDSSKKLKKDNSQNVDSKDIESIKIKPLHFKPSVKIDKSPIQYKSEYSTALTDASEFENGFLFPMRISQNINQDAPKKENQYEDFSKLDKPSINKTLHQSVLIPLTIQMKLVNDALLKYYIKDLGLLSHLNSLRNFFFLLDGEFGHNLTDALFIHLNKISRPEDLLNSRSLNYILAKALESSIKGNEINGSRLSFSIKFMPKHIQNSSPEVLSCLSLQYKVTWPLNILISEELLLKYDKIFEYLLKIRRVSWVLDQDFQKLKFLYKDPQIDSLALSRSPQYHTIQIYRNEMTHLIRALQNYIISIALQASWMELQQLLNKSETLDQLYKIHVSYVKKVLFRCLLNDDSAPIQAVILDICGFILKFHGLVSSRNWSQNNTTKMYEHPNYEMIINVVTKFKKSSRFLYKYALKLATTGYQSFSIELVNMLNINDYYSNQKKSLED